MKRRSPRFQIASRNPLSRAKMAVGSTGRGLSAYEELLRNEVEAIIFVRIPQLPSSRAAGAFPVASIDEYMQRVPADKSQWKTVPVGPRPFPPEFVTADTEPEKLNNGALPVIAGLLLGGALVVRTVRRRHARRQPAS